MGFIQKKNGNITEPKIYYFKSLIYSEILRNCMKQFPKYFSQRWKNFFFLLIIDFLFYLALFSIPTRKSERIRKARKFH